jgi:replication factor C subunit 2/4
MTAGAQQALRRTMEIYSNTTRFCLACNMSNKIIEPIQSRCAILRYAKLSDREVLQRLLEICAEEKVSLRRSLVARLLVTLNPPGRLQRRWPHRPHIYLGR